MHDRQFSVAQEIQLYKRELYLRLSLQIHVLLSSFMFDTHFEQMFEVEHSWQF